MRMINRFALIVRPADPYIEWAAQVAKEPIAQVRDDLSLHEASVYLLPESTATDAEDSALLKGSWKRIFQAELEGWSRDESTWPKHRSEALFRAWFRIELGTVVVDLGKAEIQYEEL